MGFRPFLIVALVFAAPAWGARIYRFPIQPFRTPATPAVRPLPGPVDIAVWNLFGEGHFNAIRTTYVPADSGLYRRGVSERINILAGLAPASAQDCGQALIDGSVMKRIEHGAFSDMERDGYMPPGDYSHFLESAHARPGEQMSYFESLSWHRAAEILEVFGGKIPWERVAELEGPDFGVQSELRAMAEHGSDQIRLRIRRASIGLVAGQFIPAPPGTSLASFLPRGSLPFETDADLGPHAFELRAHPTLQFELTRTGQLKGLVGEVDDLAQFALGVAAHQSFVIGNRRPETWIFTTALDRRRRVFFERKLGVRPVLEVGEKTLLRGTLDEVLEKKPPSQIIESLAKVRAAVGPKVPEALVIELLQRYRRTFRRDLEFVWGTGWTGDLTHPDGAIVSRDHSSLFRLRYESQAAPIAEFYGFSLEKLWAALQGEAVLQTPAQFLYFKRDRGAQDWSRYGIAPVAFSNLSPTQARDPAYVRKLLIGIARGWNTETVPIAVSSLDPEIQKQLVAAGMRELGDGNYVIDLAELRRRTPTWPEWASAPDIILGHGYWQRARTLYDLEGL